MKLFRFFETRMLTNILLLLLLLWFGFTMYVRSTCAEIAVSREARELAIEDNSLIPLTQYSYEYCVSSSGVSY